MTNDSDTPLVDVAYVSSTIGERIGDLAPGQEAEFRVPATNFNGSSASDQVYGFGGFDPADPGQRDLIMRRQVIDALVGYGSFVPGGIDTPTRAAARSSSPGGRTRDRCRCSWTSSSRSDTPTRSRS